MFWTKTHAILLIPTFIVIIIAAWFIGYKLKDKDEKAKRLPLQIVTIVLVVFELIKQIRGFVVGYDLYWLPLHFCSLFLFTLPFASFYNGKHKEIVDVITGVVGACLFMFMAIYPNIVYSEEYIVDAFKFITFRGGNFVAFHSVAFHSIALFSYFLFLFLNICKFNTKRDLISVIIFFLGYCVIVGTIAQLIDTNFNNFCRSNAPFLEDMRVNMISSMGFGGQIIYILMISVGTIIVPILAYFVFRLISFINRKYIIKTEK